MGCSWCKSKRRKYKRVEPPEQIKKKIPFRISGAWLMPIEKQNVKKRLVVTEEVSKLYKAKGELQIDISEIYNDLRKRHNIIEYTHLIITFSVNKIRKAFGHSYYLKNITNKKFPVSNNPNKYVLARDSEDIRSVHIVFKQGNYINQRDVSDFMQVFYYDSMRQFYPKDQQQSLYSFIERWVPSESTDVVQNTFIHALDNNGQYKIWRVQSSSIPDS